MLPGGSAAAAHLHLARTVVRRAERRVVACVDAGDVAGDTVLPWLNRVSDVLFILARTVERRAKRR